jgi:hypothetical protein
LQNALNQTQEKDAPAAKDWRILLLSRLETISSQALCNDIAGFLEHPGDAALLDRENLRAMLTFNSDGGR